MRNSSRQRGQGATEYILILAFAVIFILALLFIFRGSIGGTTEKITSVVSGKDPAKAAASGATAAGESSSSPDRTADQDSPPKRGEAGAADRPGSDSDGSSVEGKPEEPPEERAQAVSQEGGGSAGRARGLSFRGSGARGIAMWVLIAIAGALVLVVGYFLSAASR